MPVVRCVKVVSLLLASSLFSISALADLPEFEILIRDHRFEPSVLEIPPGQKVRIVVKNTDPTPEEFESYELRREKVIAGNSQAIIYIGPLKPGEYPFFGEFNPETAQGRLIVK